MTVHEMAEKLSLQTICEPDPDREVTGGYTGDLLSWVMGRAQSGDVWLTIMSNQNVVAVATLADTAAVIFTEGVQPDAGVRELAEKKDVNLYSSPDHSFAVGAKVAALL
jgi:hypothetical protein